MWLNRGIVSFFVASLVLGVAPATGAAASLRVGVTGSAGLGHMSYGSGFDKVKFGGGLSLDAPLDHGLSARSGIFWRPNGSQLGSAIPEVNSWTLRFDYIAVPLGATYRFHSNERVALIAYGAMEWSYLVKAVQLTDDMNEGRTELDVTDSMNSWDIAPVLGIAISTAGGFEIGLQHSWGLRGVYEDSGDLKNMSLCLLGTMWIDFP